MTNKYYVDFRRFYDNFSLKLEIFGSFNYTVPKDKEQQLYDFYMLNFLKGKSSFDVRRQDIIQQQGYDIYQLGKPHSPDPKNMDAEDKVDYMVREVANTLIPTLKKNLLDAVLFAIMAEVRHIFDIDRSNSIIQKVKDDLGESYAKILKEYTKRFTLHKSNLSGPIMRPVPIDNRDLQKGRGEYTQSYKAMLQSGGSPLQWARIAKYLFENGSWQHSFGGSAWAGIADGWLRLYDAKNEDQNMIAIDHIYDLQHNTDTVFNKLESYLKYGSYSWIKKALDHKAAIKDPHEIIHKISPAMTNLAARAIKMKFGKSLEEFKKEKEDNKPKPFATPTKSNEPIATPTGKSNEPLSSEYSIFNNMIKESFVRMNSGNGLPYHHILARICIGMMLPYDIHTTPSDKMLDYISKTIGEINPLWKNYTYGHDIVLQEFKNELELIHYYEDPDRVQALNKFSGAPSASGNVQQILGVVNSHSGMMNEPQINYILATKFNKAPAVQVSHPQEIKNFLVNKNLISAIKAIREDTNWPLLASKGLAVFWHLNNLIEKPSPYSKSLKDEGISEKSVIDVMTEMGNVPITTKIARTIMKLGMYSYYSKAAPPDTLVDLLSSYYKENKAQVKAALEKEWNAEQYYMAHSTLLIPGNKTPPQIATKELEKFKNAPEVRIDSIIRNRIQSLLLANQPLQAVIEMEKATQYHHKAARSIVIYYMLRLLAGRKIQDELVKLPGTITY